MRPLNQQRWKPVSCGTSWLIESREGELIASGIPDFDLAKLIAMLPELVGLMEAVSQPEADKKALLVLSKAHGLWDGFRSRKKLLDRPQRHEGASPSGGIA